MFSVPAKDWTKQAPTWSSHLSIHNLRDWEVKALVVNMLPIHDLVDRLLILCAEPKHPLLHGCMCNELRGIMARSTQNPKCNHTVDYYLLNY